MFQASEMVGRQAAATRTLLVSTALNEGDNTVFVDATAGAVTLTLPNPLLLKGKRLSFKKIDSSANAVTISPFGSETIDGASSFVMAYQNAFIELLSDGTNWQIVNETRILVLNEQYISAPAAAGYWQFAADVPCKVVAINEVHSVVSGGGATLKIRKVTDTSAPGATAGATVVEQLSSALALDSTINTSVTGSLSATASDHLMAAGDKLAFLFAGTMTGYVGAVSVMIQRL
jgi:hypothetical protein